MSYRPQFAFPGPPAGYADEPFHYIFNNLTTPLFRTGSVIPAAGSVNDIPLLLDYGSEFHWRGTNVGRSMARVQFRDPYGNQLSDGPVGPGAFEPAVSTSTGGTLFGWLPVPVESEIICPPGSLVNVSLYNPTGSQISLASFWIMMRGVKRFKV